MADNFGMISPVMLAAAARAAPDGHNQHYEPVALLSRVFSVPGKLALSLA
jgi:hypothetical protein